ncbi:MAG: SDR family NAD(P)-dependent oxidoreductase [Chitinophagaceae bacterium]|nr:MAG: SDR family NAD(P)-dependent oxidoreductase [Chitinophagaceae bacterium]
MATAIVTGISGNLGEAVATRLLADGYRVAGSYGSKKPEGFESNNQCTLLKADLTSEAEAGRFVTECIAALKSVDVAVLTVGGFEMGDLASAGSEAINKMMQVNFNTAYNVARPVFQSMKENGYGRIFLAGSLTGIDPSKGKSTVAYTLSKSLLSSLAQLLNAEAGDSNIVTSLVVPSTIDTPQNRKAMPDADFATWVRPETIAGVISWYAGPEAGRIRQPIIQVTGKSV